MGHTKLLVNFSVLWNIIGVLTTPQSRPELCGLPSAKGICTGDHLRYYYSEQGCKAFIYSGCGGNENNFVLQEDCKRTCLEETVLPEPNVVQHELQPLRIALLYAEIRADQKEIIQINSNQGNHQ